MSCRPGTIGAQRESERDIVPVVVPAVGDMLHSVFVTHCRMRHSAELRFVTINEHEAAHRLRDHQDHTHDNHIDEPPQPETQTVAQDTKKPEGRARRAPAR